MPEPKRAIHMTTEEIAQRVFPEEVVEELKRLANEPKPPRKPSASSQDQK